MLSTVGYRVFILGVIFTVVRPLTVCRFNDNGFLIFRDFQRTISCSNSIVTNRCCGTCSYGDTINCSNHIRLGAGIGDRTVGGHSNIEGMRIAFFQLTRGKTRLHQRITIISLFIILSSYSHCLRIDRQRTNVRYNTLVVAGCVGRSASDSIRISIIVRCVVRNIRNAFCCCSDRHNISVFKSKGFSIFTCSNFFSIIGNGINLFLM